MNVERYTKKDLSPLLIMLIRPVESDEIPEITINATGTKSHKLSKKVWSSLEPWTLTTIIIITKNKKKRRIVIIDNLPRRVLGEKYILFL